MKNPIINLPRGAGTITYDKRNSSNPYIARRYDHTDENGNSIYIYIGSYPNEIEAYLALKEASFKTNEELKNDKYKFEDIYNLLINREKSLNRLSSIRLFRACYNHSTVLYNRVYKEISADDMQTIINGLKTGRMQQSQRTFFRKMDEVADEHDVIRKRRSQFLQIKQVTKQIYRYPLSDKEVYALLERKDIPEVQMVLVLLYTGFRGGELRKVKKKDVDVKLWTITGGIKTDAGTNRIIPVHPRIVPIIESWMKGPGEYLLPFNNGDLVKYKSFVRIFNKAITPIAERNHVPHECRHTFRTRLDDKNANEICIDLLMGHKTPNPVERTYCHKSLDQLREAIMTLW